MASSELSLPNLRQNPALRQIAALVGIAAAVAIGVALFMWSQKPGYAPLYTGLTDADAAEVSEALRAASIDFRLEAATGALLVPAGEVHAARLKLAAQGLPRSSGTGFELIREEAGLGVSQFMESARYQHALETELGRTVVSLQPIKSARVHLAMPRPSAFARSRRPASASVLVALYPGRRLEPGQVAAIVNLVASSIPDLEASQVTVIDQAGRLLSSPERDEQMALSSSQFELVRELEERYVRRIEELLLPVAGPGRSRAQVSLSMDFTASEETRESYEPGRAALRSEQLSEESLPTAAGGVPGAVSNRPPANKPEPPEADAMRSRQSTRNYEIDRTVSRVRQSPGRIRRVSAAVLVDHLQDGQGGSRALNPDEIARIESLVREAVGFDAERGDSVNVQNLSFVQQEMPDISEPPLWEQPSILTMGRHLIGLVMVLLLAFLVLRPALRQALQPMGLLSAGATAAGALPGNAPVAVAGEERLEADPEEPAPAPAMQMAVAADPFEERLGAVRQAVGQDPKRVAQVVRSWLNEE